MKLVNEVNNYCGAFQKFEGENGVAILTKNCGNKDKQDRWSLTVVIQGSYQEVAKRIEYSKAYALAEELIK